MYNSCRNIAGRYLALQTADSASQKMSSSYGHDWTRRTQKPLNLATMGIDGIRDDQTDGQTPLVITAPELN